MNSLNIPIAFIAGLMSFFAPCVIPLIPAYIGYLAGVSLSELERGKYSLYLKKILVSSLLYVLGFSIIFVILGATAAGLGIVLRRYDYLIQRVGGAIMLFFGLEFAGILRIPFLAKEKRLNLPKVVTKFDYLRSLVFGMIFGISWTPCIGAVLGSILSLAAITATLSRGVILLFFYSLGISLPFLIVSLTLASAPKYIRIFSLHSRKISIIGGLLLALLGLLFLTNTFRLINAWIFDIVGKLGIQ